MSKSSNRSETAWNPLPTLHERAEMLARRGATGETSTRALATTAGPSESSPPASATTDALDEWTKTKLHAAVRKLPCVITGSKRVTLHHVRGGSIAERGWRKSLNQKVSEALVIPLHADYHVGNKGIDSGMGVKTWEQRYGRQSDFVDAVSRQLGVDLWALAEKWRAR